MRTHANSSVSCMETAFLWKRGGYSSLPRRGSERAVAHGRPGPSPRLCADQRAPGPPSFCPASALATLGTEGRGRAGAAEPPAQRPEAAFLAWSLRTGWARGTRETCTDRKFQLNGKGKLLILISFSFPDEEEMEEFPEMIVFLSYSGVKISGLL